MGPGQGRLSGPRVRKMQPCTAAGPLDRGPASPDCARPMTRSAQSLGAPTGRAESPYAWLRLLTAMLLGTIGGVGMWSFVVALPAVQTEFAVDRAAASLPFTLTMIGFGIGGVLMGWLSDRFGLIVPVVLGGISLALGYVLTGYATTLWQFTIAYGVLIGFGSSATLGPMDRIAEDLTARTGRETVVVDDAERPVPLVFSWATTRLDETVEELVSTGQVPA